jgi:glycosyltransferase involved in cell wall biosynthesis
MNEQQKNKKVLYLARWYPNRYDPMPGLFIQRHAEAAAKFCSVGVVYTHVVDNEKIKGFDLDLSMVNGVPTAKVYYSNSKINIPLISPIIRALRFFKANRIGIKKINEELEGFDLIHVHILTRLGIIAYWYKLVKAKPYVISEHWSRYLALTGDFNGFFRKWVTRIVVKNASVVTTVTQNLANAMQSHGLKNDNYRVLANVVTDDFLKFPIKKKQKRGNATFIHVSCFEDKSKNISGLLRVIKSLSDKRFDFKFKLVGEGMDFEVLKEYAREIGLGTRSVEFTGLLEGKELVKEMDSADMMVVFSNYENFPVVINESFVLGIPVISTNVGGIPEYVNDSNGRLINAGDEEALEAFLNDYLDRKHKFNTREIQAKSREAFSPVTIGMELCAIYDSLME